MGGVARGELERYLADLLEIDQGGDWAPNGLQVEGRETIRRLVTGVTANQALFDRAREAGADAVLVHHGLFLHGRTATLTGMTAKRVRTLFEGGISLFAYHLPLDRHPVYGNNALAARAFGLVELEPFAEAKGMPVGFRGRFEQPIAAAELVRRCAEIYAQAPLVYDAGPDPLRTLGIVSGGAQRELQTAIDLGLDAFITGEVSEWVMSVAEESGIHYLAAGHYATERLGVRALGEHLAERYGIEATFIDVPNPA